MIAYMKTIRLYFIFCYRNSLYISTFMTSASCYKCLIKLFILTSPQSEIGILFDRWQVGLGNQQAGHPQALPTQAIIITMMLAILNATFALT
jgi:hypothetical protein